MAMQTDKASEDPSICCASFDLQKVQLFPKCHVGDIYYLSKIRGYNFTIYDMKTENCICNLWN